MDFPLIVVCGSGVEGGKGSFWAVDTSESRIFLVPENTRVDDLTAALYDFIGKDFADPVVLKPTVLSKRGEAIVKYLKKKGEKANDH